MKQTILALTLLLSVSAAAQQARMCNSGIIEYEKTVNMFDFVQKKVNKDNESYMQKTVDEYKGDHDRFKKDISRLTFTTTNTIYIPVDNASAAASFLDKDPAVSQPNQIFHDLTSGIAVTHKVLPGQQLLVQDSIRTIKWKITDETREIAGFTCRRANALIMDSVYVVAFFTNRIPVSGGPESFSGLPGMILGVALPHEHLTWFATSVIDKVVTPDAIQAPSGGKLVDHQGLQDEVNNELKGTDAYAQFSKLIYLL